MTATGTVPLAGVESVVSETWLGVSLPHEGPGLVVVSHARAPVLPGGVPVALDAPAGLVVTLHGREGPLVTAALAVARRAATVAVTVHLGGPPEGVFEALAFAVHLHTRRGRDPVPVRPCITMAAIPDLSDAAGAVRLPHLTLVRWRAARVDAVIWEVMQASRVADWLGAPLPDQVFVERHLPELLAIRRQARTGTLPCTAAGVELANLLRDRYLSLRLVYQHPELFRTLLGVERARSQTGADRGDAT